MNSAIIETIKIPGNGIEALPFVRIQKIGRPDNAPVATADWKEYQPGSARNSKSLPEGYALSGWLLESIEMGRPVRLLRVERNGVAALGIFETSPVQGLTQGGFETENSIYQVDRCAFHEH